MKGELRRNIDWRTPLELGFDVDVRRLGGIIGAAGAGEGRSFMPTEAMIHKRVERLCVLLRVETQMANVSRLVPAAGEHLTSTLLLTLDKQLCILGSPYWIVLGPENKRRAVNLHVVHARGGFEVFGSRDGICANQESHDAHADRKNEPRVVDCTLGNSVRSRCHFHRTVENDPRYMDTQIAKLFSPFIEHDFEYLAEKIATPAECMNQEGTVL